MMPFLYDLDGRLRPRRGKSVEGGCTLDLGINLDLDSEGGNKKARLTDGVSSLSSPFPKHLGPKESTDFLYRKWRVRISRFWPERIQGRGRTVLVSDPFSTVETA